MSGHPDGPLGEGRRMKRCAPLATLIMIGNICHMAVTWGSLRISKQAEGMTKPTKSPKRKLSAWARVIFASSLRFAR